MVWAFKIVQDFGKTEKEPVLSHQQQKQNHEFHFFLLVHRIHNFRQHFSIFTIPKIDFRPRIFGLNLVRTKPCPVDSNLTILTTWGRLLEEYFLIESSFALVIIRNLAVMPMSPLIVTSSDSMQIFTISLKTEKRLNSFQMSWECTLFELVSLNFSLLSEFRATQFSLK